MIISKLKELIYFKLRIAQSLQFIVNFAARLILAMVFFNSGRLKLPEGFLGIGQGSWDSTLYLFINEYKIPLISPVIAAYLGTGVEILAPFFLVIGLGTRIAALALFIMSLLIELTYVHNFEHIYWLTLSAFLCTYGGGAISIDRLIIRKIANNSYK